MVSDKNLTLSQVLLLLLLLPILLSVASSIVITEPPMSVNATYGTVANFNCIGNGAFILWSVNEKYVLDFEMDNGVVNSTLHIPANETHENASIQCSVGTNKEIISSPVVYLMVKGIGPVKNLTLVNALHPLLTWKNPFHSTDVTNITYHVNVVAVDTGKLLVDTTTNNTSFELWEELTVCVKYSFTVNASTQQYSGENVTLEMFYEYNGAYNLALMEYLVMYEADDNCDTMMNIMVSPKSNCGHNISVRTIPQELLNSSNYTDHDPMTVHGGEINYVARNLPVREKCVAIISYNVDYEQEESFQTFSTQRFSVDDDNGILCFTCSFANNSELYTSGCNLLLFRNGNYVLNISIPVLQHTKCVGPLEIGWYWIEAFDILANGVGYEGPAVTSSYYVSVGLTATTQPYSINTEYLVPISTSKLSGIPSTSVPTEPTTLPHLWYIFIILLFILVLLFTIITLPFFLMKRKRRKFEVPSAHSWRLESSNFHPTTHTYEEVVQREKREVVVRLSTLSHGTDIMEELHNWVPNEGSAQSPIQVDGESDQTSFNEESGDTEARYSQSQPTETSVIEKTDLGEQDTRTTHVDNTTHEASDHESTPVTVNSRCVYPNLNPCGAFRHYASGMVLSENESTDDVDLGYQTEAKLNVSEHDVQVVVSPNHDGNSAFLEANETTRKCSSWKRKTEEIESKGNCVPFDILEVEPCMYQDMEESSIHLKLQLGKEDHHLRSIPENQGHLSSKELVLCRNNIPILPDSYYPVQSTLTCDDNCEHHDKSFKKNEFKFYASYINFPPIVKPVLLPGGCAESISISIERKILQYIVVNVSSYNTNGSGATVWQSL